jgi:DNA-binding transcriptional LysR family regulator
MNRTDFGELNAFAAVARHRSFTRAGVELGLALPTVSQTIRTLEERLGVRLFNRTTRSVALTEAGARLLAEVTPILARLEEALESVNSFRDKPMGTLRIGVMRPYATRLVAPLLQPFQAEYPQIRLEVVVEDARTDLVKAGLDAGVRIGHQVERDMTTLRIAEPFRMIAVASPAYLEGRETPRAPRDLHAHNCIRVRAPWSGALIPWLFERGEARTEVAVEGHLTVNDADLLIQCVLDGVGVGYLPEPLVAAHVEAGELVHLLKGWSGERTGVFLYHPSRRQPPAPLQAFIGFVEARLGEGAARASA